MIPALVVAALAAVALAYVLGPLRRGPRRDAPDPASLLEEANEKKTAALSAILDLEVEREMGKLSEADFQALAHDYEAEAVAALHQLDALGTPEADALEAEIASVKRRLRCPSCGALRAPGRACSQCGE